MRAVIAIASPPFSRIAAAASSHGSWLRDEITTLAPASAKASAIARPMPRDDPVTIATFPVRSKRFIIGFLCRFLVSRTAPETPDRHRYRRAAPAPEATLPSHDGARRQGVPVHPSRS